MINVNNMEIYNSVLNHLKASETLLINEKSIALEKAGQEVYKLGFGQSPFPVPAIVQEALRQHVHQKDYLPVQGLPALRTAVANHMNRLVPGMDWSADQVLVGPGSKELLFLVQWVLDIPLILPSPSWVSYVPQAKLLKKAIHYIGTSRNHWKLSAEELQHYLSKEKLHSGLLLLNYPNNPTGLSYTPEELENLASVCRQHGILVLADEIYGLVQYDERYVSIASYYPEGTIITTGLSKWCGAGGWRIGVVLAPFSMKKLIDGMKVIASETFSAVSAPIQYAAITAYSDQAELLLYRKHVVFILKMVSEYCYRQLIDAGFELPMANGGFYLFPNFGIEHTAKIKTSAELCKQILADTGVALLPGSAFGRPPTEMTVRLCIVDFDGAKSLQHFSQWGKIANNEFSSLFPKIVKGMDLLTTWYRHSNFVQGTQPFS